MKIEERKVYEGGSEWFNLSELCDRGWVQRRPFRVEMMTKDGRVSLHWRAAGIGAYGSTFKVCLENLKSQIRQRLGQYAACGDSLDPDSMDERAVLLDALELVEVVE